MVEVVLNHTKNTIQGVLGQLKERTAQFMGGQKSPFYWHMFQDVAQNGVRESYERSWTVNLYEKFSDEIDEISEEIKDFVIDAFSGNKSFAELLKYKNHGIGREKTPQKDHPAWKFTIAMVVADFVARALQAFMREKIEFYEKNQQKLIKKGCERQKSRQYAKKLQKNTKPKNDRQLSF
jgi:hypothetical protein